MNRLSQESIHIFKHLRRLATKFSLILGLARWFLQLFISPSEFARAICGCQTLNCRIMEQVRLEEVEALGSRDRRD